MNVFSIVAAFSLLMPMARSSSDAFSTVELLNETLMDLTMLVHNLHEEIYRPGDPVPTNAYDFYEFHNAQPFSRSSNCG